MANKFQKEIDWIRKEKYQGKDCKQLQEDIKRLKTGEPLDYIIGFSWFMDLKIDLKHKPLIPRAETEYWTENAISEIKKDKICRKIKVLDIFSGSGCIGIAILKNIENSHVTFSDKNKNFTKQIKINCKLNNIPANRYKIVTCSLFSKIKENFDYILANPPYIPDKRKLPKSVVNYEPAMALRGGHGGLDIIKKFLKQAPSRLEPKGKIFLEFDTSQKVAIEQLVKKTHKLEYNINKDQYNKWRWAQICKKN